MAASIPSVTELQPTADDVRLARLAALALGLAVIEAALPSPLPGIKPGLANIVTMLVLLRLGWRAACWVSLLRVLGASLMLGSFLTPGFFLSLAGALCSLLVLGACRVLPQRWFGPVSLSLFAAFAHIGGQLLLAWVWLLPSAAITFMLPVFAAAAWVFGLSNGLLCAHLLSGLERGGK